MSAGGWHFADPGWLWLTLVPCVMICLRRLRGSPAVVDTPLATAADAVGAPSVVRPPWGLLLSTLGQFLMAAALARPVVTTALPLEVKGLDVMLVLDVSSSMNADDLARGRTRLDVSKGAAQAFVEGRPDDRIGLVTFARYSDLRCPPTLDHVALDEFLADVVPVENEGPEDATAIGAALGEAATLLSADSDAARVVILLTDGEENVATAQTPSEIAPLHAAQLCLDAEIRVHAIAAGPEEGAAAVDTTDLEAVAKKTGGRFFRARDREALERVYEEIDTLETSTFAAPRYQTEDRFLGVLLLGLAVYVVGRILRAARPGTLP